MWKIVIDFWKNILWFYWALLSNRQSRIWRTCVLRVPQTPLLSDMYDTQLHLWQIGQNPRWWQRPFWKCDISVLYRDCLCVCSCFPKPPKVPGSWDFESRPNLGQLKTWGSPIIDFFHFTDSRAFFRANLNCFYCFYFFYFFFRFLSKLSAIFSTSTMKCWLKIYFNTICTKNCTGKF